MQELELFSTPLTIIENFIDKKTIKKILNKNIKMKEHPAIPHKGKSSFNIDDKVLKNEHNLKNKINKELKSMSKKMGLPDQKISNNWINVQQIDSTLLPHRHKSSYISGVLYLNIDPKTSGIIFHCPNPYIYMQPVKEYTKYNYETFVVYPVSGTLIMFPSWLSHSSEINKTNNRCVLSFNTTNLNNGGR